MPPTLLEGLRARGFVPPDYRGGRGLLNVPATVLEVLRMRDATDPPPLAELDASLTEDVRQVVVIFVDGLGSGQLARLATNGDMPFVASILERARRRDAAQLLDATTIFPSTTAAAITTMHTARTPQEHGNIAYFLWLDEFEQLTQMLRWGRAADRRGSYFDDAARDPLEYVKVPSIHARIRERGGKSYLIEPEPFRNEAMARMHAAEAEYLGYILPTTMGVRLGQLLRERPWGSAPAYVYGYWAGVDTAAHQSGPRSSEHAAEAASVDLNLSRALAARPPGDTLVILTADHGHAAVDPNKLIDLVDDAELTALLRNPMAGEPRVVFLHTDHPEKVRAHLERRWPGEFFIFDREAAIAEGLFGYGDPALVRARVGEVCALLGGDRGAAIVTVDGQLIRHRGSHGGMSPDEMNIPVLIWRA